LPAIRTTTQPMAMPITRPVLVAPRDGAFVCLLPALTVSAHGVARISHAARRAVHTVRFYWPPAHCQGIPARLPQVAHAWRHQRILRQACGHQHTMRQACGVLLQCAFEGTHTCTSIGIFAPPLHTRADAGTRQITTMTKHGGNVPSVDAGSSVAAVAG